MLLQMVRVNNFQEDVCVNKEFGIQVKEELALFNARVLPAPRVSTWQYVILKKNPTFYYKIGFFIVLVATA